MMRRHEVLRLPEIDGCRALFCFIRPRRALRKLPAGTAARNAITAGVALEQRVAPWRRKKGANGCATPMMGAPFLPLPHPAPPAESVVAQVSTLSLVSYAAAALNISWHACSISAIILHHAPGPSGLPHRLPYCTACLPVRRVHVEPRPPDIEESSEFSRTPAGKDGIRQGRNVPSPPPPQPDARAHNATVRSTCSLLALGQQVWEQPSASTKLYAPKSAFGGATAKQPRMAPHG
jgi:hypothetical protein